MKLCTYSLITVIVNIVFVYHQEILSCVMVKNLDTGEMVALKDADDKLPKCVDPLVLHMMERTNEYPGFVTTIIFKTVYIPLIIAS